MGPTHLRPPILLDQQLIIIARLSAFFHEDCSRAAFFPASRIDDQSLPWGKRCLLPSSRVGISPTRKRISCHIALPRIPRVVTVSRERVARSHCTTMLLDGSIMALHCSSSCCIPVMIQLTVHHRSFVGVRCIPSHRHVARRIINGPSLKGHQSHR